MLNDVNLSLSGNSITLQPFTAEDISDAYISWLNDPEVVRYSNQRFRVHTPESSLAYLSSFTGTANLFLGIRHHEHNRLVGTITAYRSLPHQTADLGILIGDRRCWGKGIGLDAWSCLMTYLLTTGNLRKVTGGTLRCNVGMVRIMELSGMALEAVRAQQELIEQVPVDALYYTKFRNA